MRGLSGPNRALRICSIAVACVPAGHICAICTQADCLRRRQGVPALGESLESPTPPTPTHVNSAWSREQGGLSNPEYTRVL